MHFTFLLLLKDGPRLGDLSCSGNVIPVLDLFSEVIALMVGFASRFPHQSSPTIGLLCTIPYQVIRLTLGKTKNSTLQTPSLLRRPVW